jgi:hypothetical protein
MGTKNKVAIIGGGLAGLAAAIYLNRKSIEFDLFEASNTLGGRVATEELSGFMLDKGFQVFLDSYEEARAIIDFDELGLEKASSGAMIRNNGRWKKFGNPLKRISDALPTLFSRVGNLKDKFLIYKLSREVARTSEAEIQLKTNLSTYSFLQKYGFSIGMIENFFKPFFGGVFLDFKLETSSRLFLYLFKKFAEGNATLPKEGMQAIVKAMQVQLPAKSIHLNTEIDLNNVGDYKATIVAINKSSLKVNMAGEFNGTSCLYFSCDTVSLSDSNYLHLNPAKGLVRHVCFLNRIQPSYAPTGKDLLSVTVNFDENTDEKEVEGELAALFGNQLKGLKFIKAFHIPEALSFYNGEMTGVAKNAKGQIICGDHTLYPSINAAIKSGRLAAEIVLRDLA